MEKTINSTQSKEQVLSIEQCKELLSLGFDMSDASAMWTAIVDNEYNPIKWLPMLRNNPTPIEALREKLPMTYKEGNVYYTYTLQDILQKLPRTLQFKNVYGNPHFEYIEFWGDGWNQMAIVCPGHSSVRFSTSSISMIQSAFEMLKYCKQNNFI